MKLLYAFFFSLILPFVAPTEPMRAVGDWHGTLQTPSGPLRLIITIEAAEDGTLTGALESVDQAPGQKIPMTSVAATDTTLAFEVATLGASYEGTWDEGTQSWVGTFKQSGLTFPLTFTRGLPEPRVRPQTPKAPFPYRTEEVNIANTDAEGVTLAGTLTLPEGEGPFPAAILITGSGPQDRDETIFEHKPFAVLADHLTRNGIAVLRYDDRGFGASTGTFGGATSADFATDANAVFRYLMNRPEIDKDAIGFIGHSEGGVVGPLAALSNDDLGFLVMLAAPGVQFKQLLLTQRRMIGMLQGASEEYMRRGEPILLALYDTAASARNREEAEERVRALLTPEALATLGATEAQKDALVRALAGDWFRYILHYDPAAVLPQIRVPVLALNGSLDVQVAASENLPGIRAALSENPDVTVMELENLNHLFQTAKTGAPIEYARIEETFAPKALKIISRWINERFGPSAKK